MAGRMAMQACQIGPTDTAPPRPGSPLRACVGTKGGTLWGRQPFCPHFSSATQVCVRCDYTLPSFRDRSGSRDLRPRWWIGCRMSPKLTGLDRLLLPLLGCWRQKMGRMARSGIGCWVAAAMGRLCHSCAISILRRIVRATKAATWSHPSALFSIIGTKFHWLCNSLCTNKYSEILIIFVSLKLPLTRDILHSNTTNLVTSFGAGIVDTSLMPEFARIVDIRHTGTYGNAYAVTNFATSLGYAAGNSKF